MSIISIIDSTLRDGGYLNNWQFDNVFQYKAMNALINSNVDIIECGFISENTGNDAQGTNFKSIERVNTLLKAYKLNNSKSKFAIMTKIDEYNPDNLPYCNKIENTVSIIRVMIYKNEIKKAFSVLQKIIEKGYELHIQPTIISHYTDEEIVNMLNYFRDINYHAISIVDTFGALKEKDIKRITMLFDKYTNKNAKLSIHCHDNMSLAYQNSITFTNSIMSNRDVYVDCSIGGIGRGAGNLPTEFMITWLKNEKNMRYLVSPVKNFCNKEFKTLNKNIKDSDYYAFNLTAQKNIHPNYAIWLILQKYSRIDILKILELIAPEKYETFDYFYIKNLCEVFTMNI